MGEHRRDVRAAGDRLDADDAAVGARGPVRAARAGRGACAATTAWVKQTSPTTRPPRLDGDPRPPRAVGDAAAPAVELAARRGRRPARRRPLAVGLVARGHERGDPRDVARPGRRTATSAGSVTRPAPRRAGAVAAVVERPRHRGDDQRADARVAEHGEPVAHDVRRAAQRHGVDQLAGQRGGRLVLAPVEVEVLHLAARRPRSRSAARAGCRSSASASPSRRRRAPGTGASRRARRRGRRSPASTRSGRCRSRRTTLPSPARAKPSSSSGRNSATCSGENSVGIQPSAISAVSVVFFGPIAAM